MTTPPTAAPTVSPTTPAPSRTREQSLRRIAALRAKAERTTFPAEAAALHAKADALESALILEQEASASDPAAHGADDDAVDVLRLDPLDTPDALLFGLACSQSGARAIVTTRAVRLRPDTGGHRTVGAGVLAVGRRRDLASAQARFAALVARREDGLGRYRGDGDRTFRLAYGHALIEARAHIDGDTAHAVSRPQPWQRRVDELLARAVRVLPPDGRRDPEHDSRARPDAAWRAGRAWGEAARAGGAELCRASR